MVELEIYLISWKSYFENPFQDRCSYNYEGTWSKKWKEIVNQFRDPAHSMSPNPRIREKKSFPNSPSFSYLDKLSHTYFQKIKTK